MWFSKQKILEEEINMLRNKQTDLKALISKKRKELDRFNKDHELELNKEVRAKHQQEWMDKESERLAVRATDDWQKWYEKFVKKS